MNQKPRIQKPRAAAPSEAAHSAAAPSEAAPVSSTGGKVRKRAWRAFGQTQVHTDYPTEGGPAIPYILSRKADLVRYKLSYKLRGKF